MVKKAVKKTKSIKEMNVSDDFFFLDEKAKDFKFSDYVKISSYPHGMILYFGKIQPDQNKFGIFESILIPFDVAGSLISIMEDHIAKLVDKGLLEKKDSKIKVK